MDFNQFDTNTLVHDACSRKLEVIGEACNAISKDLQERSKEIKWAEIVGLRDILIHQYFGVDNMVIWSIIQFELVPLKTGMKLILDVLESES